MQSTKTKGIALNWFVFIQMHVIINGEINIHYNLNKKGNGNKRKTKKKNLTNNNNNISKKHRTSLTRMSIMCNSGVWSGLEKNIMLKHPLSCFFLGQSLLGAFYASTLFHCTPWGNNYPVIFLRRQRVLFFHLDFIEGIFMEGLNILNGLLLSNIC